MEPKLSLSQKFKENSKLSMILAINFSGGCVKCPLRALIEGHLSALASLAKTEKCPLWQKTLLGSLQNLFIIRTWRV